MRTVRRSWLVLLVFVCAASTARAELLYTFTGANNLSGTFTLAIETPSSSSCADFIPGYCSYFFASPFNSLSGTYGEYSFSGIARLDIHDLPSYYDGGCCTDQWIVRAGRPVLSPSLSGNVIGGRSVTGFNIYIGGCCGGGLFSGAPLTPPRPFPSLYTFAYGVDFSDETREFGELNTVTLVPEPPSFALLAFGVIALTVGVKYRGAQ